ncbi:MAG: hypothetical protein H0T89_02825 [Deltaproteobacteria bacterium]|nr:hypothetical protein [Deltaproteobacteria bacterium]MDQ3299350.1 hypothetical protein [Myxococcota bacterium]
MLPDSANRIRAAIEEAVQGETSRFDLPYWAQQAGDVGHVRQVSMHVTPIDQAGAVARIAISGVDITEHVLARRRAEESEAQASEAKAQLELALVSARQCHRSCVLRWPHGGPEGSQTPRDIPGRPERARAHGGRDPRRRAVSITATR